MEKKKKILVVDDELSIVKYLCTLLEDNGYETIFAQNAKQGIKLAKSELPDLICLDIAMPEETGARMLEKLQKDPCTSKIPMVVITGIPQFQDFIQQSQKYLKPPAAYFEKPIDKEKFIQEIARLVR